MSRLRETLIKLGYVSQPHMAKALEVQALYGGSLQQALLEIRAIDEAHLTAALERTFGVRNAVDVANDAAEDEALEMLRPYEAENLRILPWRKDGKVLHLVVADPSNVVQFDKLQARWNTRIQFTVVCEPRMALLLERFYHIPAGSNMKASLEVAVPAAPGKGPKSAKDAPVVDPTRKEAVITDTGTGNMPSLTISSMIDLPAPEARQRHNTMELLVPLEPAPAAPPASTLVPRVSQIPAAAVAPVVARVPKQSGSYPAFPGPNAPTPAVAATPGPAAGTFPAMPAPAPEPVPVPATTIPDISQVTSMFQVQLNDVTRREQVAPLAVAQLLRYFERAAVLTVRRNIVSGWEAAGPGVNRADFESMKVSLNEPRNVFEPVAKGALHMGGIEAFPANFPLIAAMGGTPAEHALIAPVRVKDRVVAMIYGEGTSEESLEVAMKPVRNLAEMMGKTFLRLILLLRSDKPEGEEEKSDG